MIADRIIEIYNNLDKSAFDDIRNDFINKYGPETLKTLTDVELVERLFTGAKAENLIGIRGLFTWLEHGNSSGVPRVPKGTFGRANDSRSSNGIIMYCEEATGIRGYYFYSGNHSGEPIDEETAIDYARDIREVILGANALINDMSFNSAEDYKELENKLKKLCAHKDNPYWTKNGEFRPLLLKYFHILFPNKISEFYSKNFICKVADLLGIEVDENNSNLYLNGAITLYMMNLDKNMDGIYFAQAIGYLWGESEKHQENDKQRKIDKMKNAKENELNLILYGPPGTGKTYNTVNYAVAICDNESYEVVSQKPYDEVIKRYKILVGEGRIAFTTFHQSYGYEDFIEGIRPDFDSKETKYKKVNGVFKEFCSTAIEYLHTNTNGCEVLYEQDLIKQNATVWKISLDSAGRKGLEFHAKCLNDSCIRIGWDEAEDLSLVTEDGKDSARIFIENMKKGDIVLSCYSQNEIDAIGVITGDYEWHEDELRLKRFRKVKWLRKWSGEAKYNILGINEGNKLIQKTVYKLWRISVDDIKKILNESEPQEVAKSIVNDKEQNFVFIIDEINRGNISKIFGELITLIEPSKRLGAEEEMTCTLPYSGDKFGVPKNVYILGTMNTADRSLVQLDAALRRRFDFEEMMPDYDVIRKNIGNNGVVADIDIARLLKAINNRITCLLDREHQIGHSYFLKLNENSNAEDVKAIFKKKIIPLLQEYFFDDYESIKNVLNDVFVTEENNPFNNGRKIFSINVTNRPEDYQKIYNSVVTDMADNG